MNIHYKSSGIRGHYKSILHISYNVGRALSILTDIYNKNFGVMITASHCSYIYNGFKLVNDKGLLLTNDEELKFYEIFNFKNYKYTNKYKNHIIVGYDTRFSNFYILNEFIKGCNSVGCNIINLGLVSTPMLHYSMCHNNYENQMIELLNNFNYNLSSILTIDCANGIGSILFKKLLDNTTNNTWKNIKLINTNYENYKKINNNCGADFYTSYNNNIVDLNDGLYASIDGDVDRSIFFNVHDKQIKLFDGDFISINFLNYLKNIIDEKEIIVVYTDYSNSKFVEFVNNNYNVKFIKSETGVKFCDSVARNSKYGIYFENNGHGTFINNDVNNHNLKIFNYCNNFIGDGIFNIFAMCHIGNFIDFYQKYNVYNFTIDCFDDFVLNDDMIMNCKLLEQIYNVHRIFIRKSNTENIIRVLIEYYNDFNIELLDDIIKIILN